ncbi:MAG: SDR family oxidoreductase [Caldilineaceae bacterium]|nr:SDR family oxidoreductase [Caldilineaceae bacterium]MBP8123062.1 SDR family oxidoreductase [Caldilineaceae bacterium]MBP9073399.1 SDR family oxidoreductase [Caldilineaceae bacterium]
MSVLDLFNLTGQVAIVTGGARGLGRQMALALAEAGADVAICDLLEEDGRRVVAELTALGRRSIFGKVDVTQVETIEAFIGQVIERLGKIDILVNNAGISSDGLALDEEPDDAWGRMIDTNLSSMFYFGKRVARHMIGRETGGVLINMASINSLVISNITPRHNVPYCVAKAGVAQLTRGMAADWAPHGIRVNAIAPGTMLTAQTAASRQYPEIMERIIANTPLKRYGEEEEIKGLVVYLASRASSFMTGSLVVMDGGTTIW